MVTRVTSAKDMIGNTVTDAEAARDVAALDRMIEDVDRLSVTSLTNFLNDAYTTAREARSSVDEELDYCLHAARGEYTDAERQRLEIDDGNDIFAPITPTKVTALESWLRDVFVNAEERPWTIEATEVPTLPQWMEQSITQQAAMEFMSSGIASDPEALRRRLQELKALALPEAKRAAQRAAERVETFIADQLQEGGFREAFDGFIHDFSIFPNAFIKGPFISHTTKLVWEGGKVVPRVVPAMTVSHVSPYNVFPSPNSMTTQDGGYIIERMFMPADELARIANLPDAVSYGYRPEEIMALLAAYPSGYFSDASSSAVFDFLTDSTTDTDKVYEVCVYYGYVRNSVLQDHLDRRVNTYDLAPADTSHVEIWFAGDHILRIVTIPEGRLRPLHSTSFRRQPNKFWGISLPLVLRQIQRAANACLRSLVVNMAYSSGPIFELDSDRLSLEDDLTTIAPWRVFTTTTQVLSQAIARPAITLHTVDSHSRELLGVYDRFEKMADDASGIPAYVIGAPQVSGAGRTLGGLSLLMGNAAKGIKRVVSGIDKQVIEPLVSSAYFQIALSTADQSLLADAQVKARGASGLLQRELTQARAVEVLQLLTPYVQAGTVPPDTITKLLRDIVGSLGFSPDELVPDTGRAMDVAQYLQGLGGQQVPAPNPPQANVAPDVMAQLQGGGMSQAPQVQLDNRSIPPANPMDIAKVPPA